ncbi:hypothetical protein VNI00_011679 [Paramarasmius palmivorus]|uniref:Uncharacterized protein n=1 Tax=Paramarasmius palmivorus TaxID=297713 RepID=A0AAW0CC81_9AGAR
MLRQHPYNPHAWQSPRSTNVEHGTPIDFSPRDVVDLTGLDVEFDYSCLEGLDEQLILRPIISFATVCYADAIDDLDMREHQNSKETQPPCTTCETIPEAGESDLDFSDDDSSSTSRGSDAYTFEYQSDRAPPPESDIDFGGVILEPPFEKLSPVELHHFYEVQDDGSSFISFRERYYKVSGYVETVGSFSPLKESPPRKSMSDRVITTLHSTLPSRLLKTVGQ